MALHLDRLSKELDGTVNQAGIAPTYLLFFISNAAINTNIPSILKSVEIQNPLHAKREICKAKYDDADECILLSRQNMVNSEAKLLLKSHSNIHIPKYGYKVCMFFLDFHD